ncbi:MAG: hypothetical protein Q8S10_06740, partial [Thiobacillus sp.]|nr:hypothetical protein [Thiobacillus sp.]
GGQQRTRPALLFLILFFCGRGSNTFAADPPATLDLRRVCKGKNVKTRAVMTERFEYCAKAHRCVQTCSVRTVDYLLFTALAETGSP